MYKEMYRETFKEMYKEIYKEMCKGMCKVMYKGHNMTGERSSDESGRIDPAPRPEAADLSLLLSLALCPRASRLSRPVTNI